MSNYGRVPLELLLEIFEIGCALWHVSWNTVQIKGVREGDIPRRLKKFLIPASCVCTSWHNLIQATPQFWETHISFSPYRTLTLHGTEWEEMGGFTRVPFMNALHAGLRFLPPDRDATTTFISLLRESRGSDLDIWIQGNLGAPNTYWSTVFKIIASFARRIRTICVVDDSLSSGLFSGLNSVTALPRLLAVIKCLDPLTEFMDFNPAMTHTTLMCQAPQLSLIKIDSQSLNPYNLTNNLCEIELTDYHETRPFSTWLSELRNTTSSLRRLSLEVYWQKSRVAEHDLISQPTLTLPILESLTLKSYQIQGVAANPIYFLSKLDLPRLVKLNLHVDANFRTFTNFQLFLPFLSELDLTSGINGCIALCSTLCSRTVAPALEDMSIQMPSIVEEGSPIYNVTIPGVKNLKLRSTVAQHVIFFLSSTFLPDVSTLSVLKNNAYLPIPLGTKSVTRLPLPSLSKLVLNLDARTCVLLCSMMTAPRLRHLIIIIQPTYIEFVQQEVSTIFPNLETLIVQSDEI